MKTIRKILAEVSGIPEYRLGDDKGEYITKSCALEAIKIYGEELTKWISIADELPEPIWIESSCLYWIHVLITFDGLVIEAMPVYANTIEQCKKYFLSMCEANDYTHWQLLPEPPK